MHRKHPIAQIREGLRDAKPPQCRPEALRQRSSCQVPTPEQSANDGCGQAERFVDCNPQSIAEKFKILLEMSSILLHGLRRPIVRIGRIAGQYAKPRSEDFETVEGA
ncbi:MAG: hypothetical protein EBX60_12180, partial [Betaproteobacteria bacterium]|nr:hypothetical protein [Betaproteobacteria bacterium]